MNGLDHAEYCTAAWSPYYVKDKELIEKIQHRFTKIITQVKHLSDTDRLLKLGLWTLEEHRNRADLIEVYKMIHGLTTISHNRLFELATNKKTRGNSLSLVIYVKNDLKQSSSYKRRD